MTTSRILIVIVSALLIVGVIAFGFGTRTSEIIQGKPRDRQDGLPVVRGETIDIPAGATSRFYAEGLITLRNFEVGYCLNIAPRGVFNVTETGGGRIIRIEAKSGNRELAHIESRPASRCSS